MSHFLPSGIASVPSKTPLHPVADGDPDELPLNGVTPQLESPPAQGQHSGGHTVFSAPWQFGNKGTVNNSRVKCSSFRQEF